jgi:putative ABC transport system ATP-binding protein
MTIIHPGSAPVCATDLAVELVDVEKSYVGPPPVQALAGVSVGFEIGSRTAIVGPSGSGKSSLLNLVGALDTPTGGDVRFFGQGLHGASDLELARLRRRELGFVFQAFHLLADISVVENVEMSLTMRSGRRVPGRRRIARDALERVGLADRWRFMPRYLSGGEQQRVAIARAIASKPRLLLLDEPTGNLDSASAAVVLDILDEAVAADQTVVMVTHDPQVASWADQIVTLRDGRLV